MENTNTHSRDAEVLMKLNRIAYLSMQIVDLYSELKDKGLSSEKIEEFVSIHHKNLWVAADKAVKTPGQDPKRGSDGRWVAADKVVKT